MSQIKREAVSLILSFYYKLKLNASTMFDVLPLNKCTDFLSADGPKERLRWRS